MKHFYPCKALRLLLLLCACGFARLQAQQSTSPPKPRFITGQMGLFFSSSLPLDGNEEDLNYRLPQFRQRFQANLTLSALKMKVPLNIGFTLPLKTTSMNTQSLKTFLLGPGNTLGIAPSIWKDRVRVLLGSHTVQFSPLSAGNVGFLIGTGVDVRLKKLRLAGSYGITQRGIAADISGFWGQNQRNMIAAKVGFGDLNRNHFDVNYSRVWEESPDAANSGIDTMLPRQDCGVLTIQARRQFLKAIYVKGEAGISTWSPALEYDHSLTDAIIDMADQQIDGVDIKEIHRKLSWFFPLDAISRIGFAYDLEAGITRKNWGLSACLRQIGPSYQTLAYYSFLQNYRDRSVKGHFDLLKGRLHADGQLGVRESNLTAASPDAQIIGSGNITVLPSSKVTLAASYSNFGMRTQVVGGAQASRQISHSAGFFPTVMLGKDAQHTLSGNFTYDKYKQDAVVVMDGDSISYQAEEFLSEIGTLGANYQWNAPRKISLNLGSGLIYAGNSFPQWSSTIGVRRKMLSKGQFSIMAQAQYVAYLSGDVASTKMVSVGGGATITLLKHLILGSQCNLRTYYGNRSQQLLNMQGSVKFKF